jgi:AraC family transcriptional regulator
MLPAGQYFGDVSRAAPASAFSASQIVHSQARVLPLHGHEPAYFSLLVRGHYRERSGRRELDYRPFQVAFHPPGTWHRDEVGEVGASFFCLEVDSAFLALSDVPGLSQAPNAPRFLEARATVLSARAHAERAAGHLSPLALEEYGWDLLGMASPVTTMASLETQSPVWVRRSLEMIHASIERGLTIAAIAREVDLHPVYVARAFRQRFGRTVAQHLEHLRLEAACRLLMTDASLADIASRTGFADQSHLTRTFTRRIGVPPGRYRRVLARPAN